MRAGDQFIGVRCLTDSEFAPSVARMGGGDDLSASTKPVNQQGKTMRAKALITSLGCSLLLGWVALSSDDLDPEECEQLCNVVITDPIDPPAGSGIVVTYNWLTQHGKCECSDPDEGCISLCEFKKDCSGEIRFSMNIPGGYAFGNFAGFWEPFNFGFQWCAQGQVNNASTHETLDGCGDEVGISFRWYTDATPIAGGANCDQFLSQDFFKYECGTCDGVCRCDE